MFADLISFFTKAPQNRRKYPRRSGPLPAWVALGQQWSPVGCVDISGSGLGVVSAATLPTEVNVRVMLEKRPVVVRAKRVWEQPGTAHGKPAWRYGFAFTGIAADDWDAVIRYCNNDAVALENKAQEELEMVRLKADDVARLVPKKLQDQLLQMLVERRRLAPIESGKTPLVHYSYGGIQKRNSKSLHRLLIHSRITEAGTGETKDYDTRFFFDDQGGNITADE